VAHHTTPEQAAKVLMSKTKACCLLYIVKLYGRNEQEIIKRTKERYSRSANYGTRLNELFN